ncbi:hypothetical protein A8924_0947 [Saccharopolyspora erythraea NRRL 2338]|uniref:Uncharacterized protein n=2 Tax=Saccharopolyspora erythraea TaxID=1836 RepID=A4F769_SACEN|nr:hypothetical protein [Saccharopolyspora erythraea]EQD86386.1 hypothetical protein N599_10110 [Saccharopolyspora erythraea D]PFG93696.1 hypothetical protein A8924_0947 [Saccharopolyspora erythraea NRRL 2338]QRK90540.1 hypothetical protein JQX30_03285 [Saccharopolyspora erythraea]CAL99893.1 hypothetical protein SACE_0547 [Saccharopolyspora erythraea NRRL 2338]
MTSRHYWLPVAGDIGGVRHAFRGRRWEGQPADEAVCGLAVAMAQPSEMDWITFRSCADCRCALLAEAGIEPGAVNPGDSAKARR